MNQPSQAKSPLFQAILFYWLYIIALGHVLAGLLLPVIAYSEYSDFYHHELALTFWSGQEIPQQALDFQRWIIALFGPTIASWGVLMFWLVKQAKNNKQHRPLNAILLAIMVWAPLDILISSIHEFKYHYILNIIAFLSIFVPVVILRYHLKHE